MLRLPLLGSVPPGLIPDEASTAYEAYSILKTGRDQYGELLPLFPRSTQRLNSLYLYLSLPWIAVLGLTEVAARMAAAAAGIATVGLVFVLARRAAGDVAGLVAAALLAVSPWHILVSRTGFDWVVLPACAALTAVLVLRALDGKGSWVAAGIAAGVSLYSYAPIRLWLPLLLLGLLAMQPAAVRRAWRAMIPGVIAFALLAAPVVAMTLTEEGRQRLATVGPHGPSFAEAARSFLDRYFASLSPSFFLRPADAPEVHRLRSTGLLHGFEMALVGLGALWTLWQRRRGALLLLYWVLAAPLAVSVHRDCPEPILLVTMLPAAQALAGIGASALLSLTRRVSTRAPAVVVVAGVIGAAWPVARMTRDLFGAFPVYAAALWTQGTGEMVREIESRRAGYDQVVVDGRHKFIGSLILFYSRYDPRARQVEVASLAGRQPRTVAGPYRIGAIPELLERPGRYLVWTTRADGRRLFPGRQPLHVVRLPNGRQNHALFAVETR